MDLIGSLQALFLSQDQTEIMHHQKCTRGRTKSVGSITPNFAIRRNYLSINCLQMRNAVVYGDYYKRFWPSPRRPDYLHLRDLIPQSNRHILGNWESMKTLKGSKTARVSKSPNSLDSRSQLNDIFNGIIGSSLESHERKGSHYELGDSKSSKRLYIPSHVLQRDNSRVYFWKV